MWKKRPSELPGLTESCLRSPRSAVLTLTLMGTLTSGALGANTSTPPENLALDAVGVKRGCGGQRCKVPVAVGA